MCVAHCSAEMYTAIPCRPWTYPVNAKETINAKLAALNNANSAEKKTQILQELNASYDSLPSNAVNANFVLDNERSIWLLRACIRDTDVLASLLQRKPLLDITDHNDCEWSSGVFLQRPFPYSVEVPSSCHLGVGGSFIRSLRGSSLLNFLRLLLAAMECRKH